MRGKHTYIYTSYVYVWCIHTQNERVTKMKTENSTVWKREDDNLVGRNAIQLMASNDRCWLKRDGVPKECAHTHVYVCMHCYPFTFYSIRSDLSSIPSFMRSMYWYATENVRMYVFISL